MSKRGGRRGGSREAAILSFRLNVHRHNCVCTQSSTVGGDMHLVGAFNVHTKKKKPLVFWARLHLFMFAAVQRVSAPTLFLLLLKTLTMTITPTSYFNILDAAVFILVWTGGSSINQLARRPPSQAGPGTGPEHGNCKSHHFCLILLLLQASRGQPVGVWSCHRCCKVQIKACHRCCKFT